MSKEQSSWVGCHSLFLVEVVLLPDGTDFSVSRSEECFVKSDGERVTVVYPPHRAGAGYAQRSECGGFFPYGYITLGVRLGSSGWSQDNLRSPGKQQAPSKSETAGGNLRDTEWEKDVLSSCWLEM